MSITARALVVVRKGRKRKSGLRHPCGQLIDPSKAEVTEAEKLFAKVIAINQPHRRDVPEGLRHDAKAESVLGRLQLSGRITKDEYDAGKWWGGTVRRYIQSISAPSPNPSSIAGAGTGGGGQSHLDDEEAARRKFVYDQGIFVLFQKGQRFAKAVNRTAVYDRKPELALQYLQEGLHALSIHKGLTRDENRCIKIKNGAK